MKKKLSILIFLLVGILCLVITSCNDLTDNEDHEHKYVNAKKAPTCTENGREYQLCTVCGKEVPISTTPAKGHSPNDWQTKTEPTCTVNKVEEKICKDCGVVVETKVHPIIGHTPGEWQVVRDATCEAGLMECKYCRVCEAEVDRKIGEKLNHDYVEILVPGTCAVSEHMRFTCKLCGDSYEDNFTNVYEPHTEGIWIVESAPTCTGDGVRKKICGVCSIVLDTAEAIPMDPNNHSFLVETFPPEGDETGYTRHTCKNCGYEITNVYETNLLPSQIYEMIASATVRIEACDKNGNMHSVGSGFFITDKGEIVTNYHVIAGAYRLKVKLYGGTEYEVTQVKGYNIEKDIAVLKIDLEGNSYLKLSTEEVKTGDPVYVLGSPLGVDDVFSDGVVSNPYKTVNGKPCIVFSAPISSGSSGGPLVNARGEVIGVNTQTATDGQNLNFAILISEIINLDKTGETTVYDSYIENLGTNSYNALVYYILLNYETQDENGRYIISRVIRDEMVNGAAGKTFQLIYDKEKKQVTVNIVWISDGVNLYRAEFVLDGVKTEYTARFYDYLWSQYTMEGKVSTSVQPISVNGNLDSDVYNKIFTFTNISYNSSGSGNTLSSSDAKSLIGIAFIHMLEELKDVLDNSETELTLEHFNFQEPFVPEV